MHPRTRALDAGAAGPASRRGVEPAQSHRDGAALRRPAGGAARDGRTGRPLRVRARSHRRGAAVLPRPGRPHRRHVPAGVGGRGRARPLRRRRRGRGRANAAGARVECHRAPGLVRLLSHRVGPRALRAGTRHPVSGAGERRRVARLLLFGRHRRRAARAPPQLRALPRPRPHRPARHRPRPAGGPRRRASGARRGHPVRPGALRRARRARQHHDHLPRAFGRARRRDGPGAGAGADRPAGAGAGPHDSGRGNLRTSRAAAGTGGAATGRVVRAAGGGAAPPRAASWRRRGSTRRRGPRC